MDNLIFSGCIAAIVSLIGLLVQIKLSRSSQETQKHLLHKQFSQQFHTESQKAVLSFLKETELLRIRCWQLSGQLEDSLSVPPFALDIDSFQNSVLKLREQLMIYLDSWAEVRFRLDCSSVGFLRRLRHEINSTLGTIDILTSSLIHNLRNNCHEKSIYAATSLQEHLQIVLAKLNLFSEAVSHSINENNLEINSE